MSESRCILCGASTNGPTAGGPCLQCLRGLTSAPTRVGDFELSYLVGSGSTGRVYRAVHRVSGGQFALKLPKTERAPELFLRQARFESALRHPHIVRAQLGPEHEGRPTLVMSFMSGGKLGEHPIQHGSLVQRLELALKVARAVQFAHGLGVVHCDLKADNILLDAQGEPHLCDFGLAHAIVPDEHGVVVGGTCGWMSPEQVRALDDRVYSSEHPPSVSSDVFSLGVLLHWLVTGKLPFGAGREYLTRVLHEPAPTLPRFSPSIAWGLLAIARRALEKEPQARYASVAALANDLSRLRDYDRVAGIPIPAIGRGFRWAMRHPGSRNAVLALLPCFVAATFWVANQQRDELVQAVLAMNAYAASGQAAAVLFQLRQYADELQKAAHLPAVQKLVMPARYIERTAEGMESNPCQEQTQLADPAPMVPVSKRFATMVAIDSSGCARARVAEEPSTLAYIQRRYDWRGYFADARPDLHSGSPSPGVRQAYRSSVSGFMKFAVSTPIFDESISDRPPPWIGVLIGSFTVASTLELPRTLSPQASNQLTVVLGTFEGDTPEEARQTNFAFLAHPALAHGAKVTAPPALAEGMRSILQQAPQLQFELPTTNPRTLEHYDDPLLGDHWLAAYAPVGGTSFVVLVQTRRSTATRPIAPLYRLAWTLSAASATLLLGWAALLVWQFRAESFAQKNYSGTGNN